MKVMRRVLTQALLTASVIAQAPSWMPVATATVPGIRHGHAMVYDTQRSRVVMFGGYAQTFASNALLNDTWEYDGVDWVQVATPNSPSTRHSHAMVYDIVRGVVVMHGGFVGPGTGSDTWEYDGTDWVQVTGLNGPAVYGHAMAYDVVRGKTVLFGGRSPGSQYFSETWEYDGASWIQLATANAPTGRREPSMTCDFAGKVMLFGGYSPSLLNDTWEFDGTNWTAAAPAISPSGRQSHAMVYAALGSRSVVFGGLSGSPFSTVSDTWEHDGVTWMQASLASSPPARFEHAMAYDLARNRVVLFGGHDYSPFGSSMNDTWEMEVAVASAATTYGVGCGNPALSLVSASNPIVGTTATAMIQNAPTAFGGVSMGVSDTHIGGVAVLPLDLASVGMPGCLLWHSNDVIGLAVTPASPTALQFDLAIPSQVSLLGFHVYLQAYCLAPGANPLEIVTSNGIDWGIGNQ